MKIICKSILLSKSVLRNIMFLFFVIFSLGIIFQIKSNITIQMDNQRNIIDNRTVYVELESTRNINDIKNIEFVLSVKEMYKGYEVVFQNYSDVEKFITLYNDIFDHITINSVNVIESKFLTALDTGLTVLFIIFTCVLFALIMMGVINILAEQNETIAFYKLIGFRNKSIIMLLLLIFGSIYTFLILLSFVFTFCISLFFKQYYFFSIIYLLIYAFVIFIFIFIFIYLYIKLRKITPIQCKIKNLS